MSVTPTQQPPAERRVVAFSQRLGEPGPEEHRIEAAGAILYVKPLWTREDIAVHAAEASIIVLGAVEPFDEAALSRLPHCQAIVRRGVGHDNIDVAAATRLGIVVANVPDASVEEVSDHALALLLAIERRILPLNDAVHAGVWMRDPKGINLVRSGARRLSELTLGIVGYGRIGQALARKSSGLYRRIIVADPLLTTLPAGSQPAELVTMEELRVSADHISLHAPLTDATHHLLDLGALGDLRPHAVVVNTARGGLIDEHAVITTLEAGAQLSFGLDVTEHEPVPGDDPILGAAGIVLTGHSAASSVTSAGELRSRTVDAVVDLLRHRAPASLVNPEVLGSASLRTRFEH